MTLSFGMVYKRIISSVVEPKLFLSAPTPVLAPRSRKSVAPAPATAPASDSFKRYLENYLFLDENIKTVTIFKNSSATMIFSMKFL